LNTWGAKCLRNHTWGILIICCFMIMNLYNTNEELEEMILRPQLAID